MEITKRNKTGGRVKGVSINKVTKELKEILKDVIQNEFNTIGETLQKLDPEKRLDAVIKLLPYVVPKLQNIQSEIEIKENPPEILHIIVDGVEMNLSTEKLKNGKS
ncbi:MAG: hypothetical protein WCO13_05655 [Bacteroidota bacterium]